MSKQQVALHGKDNRISGVDPIPPGRWEYAGVGDASDFENGWANAGGGLQTFRYRRTNENQTEVQGFIQGGSGNPVINLPDPYRPSETQRAVGADSSDAIVIWELTPAGDLNVYDATVGGGGAGMGTDTIWDAKGDLAAGTGADTASKLTVGSNDQVLLADSSQATGLRWGDIDGGSP